MKTIALFGGSFDPPHIGHESIVKALQGYKDIDKIIIMPTFLNPFKTSSHAPSELRLKWLEEIFKEYKNVEVSSYEVDENQKIATIQTVTYLLNSYKKIYLVVGADNIASLHKWKDYNKLKELVTFIVAPRDEINIPSQFLKLNVKIDISSSTHREKIDKNKLSKKSANEIEKYYKEYNAK